MAKQVHVNIFGIVEYEPSNMWADAMGSCRLVDVKNAIEAESDIDEIVVHINSPGGDVIEGFAIKDYLEAQKAAGKKIITAIEGRCYSIATVILLAGDQRIMGDGSEFMIHTPWTFAAGDADQLQKMVDMLRKDEEKLIAFYVEKTGADEQQIRDMVKAETFLSSDQALELKFVTEIGAAIKNKVNTSRAYAFFHEEKITDNKIIFDMNSNDKTKAKGLIATICKKFGFKNPFDNSRKAVDYTISDGDSAGKTLHIESTGNEPAVGDAATIDGQPAPDGSYTVDGGLVIDTVGGKVDAIETPGSDNNTSSEEVKNLKAQLKTATDALAKLKAEKQDDEQTITALHSTMAQLEKVTSTWTPPSDKPITDPPVAKNVVDKDKVREKLGLKKQDA